MSVITIPNKIDYKTRQKIIQSYSLMSNKNKITRKFDVFIGNSGYEPRTYGFLKSISKELQIKKSLIFLFRPKESNLYVKNLRNLKILKNFLEDISKSIEVVEINPSDPWQFRLTMKDICNKNKITSKSHVLVDITSFTRVFLYELLYSLYKTSALLLLFILNLRIM